RDVELLRHTVGVKLNLEMSINTKIVQIACRVKPDQCTLVPENRQEITTEGGLDVIKLRKKVGDAVKRLHGVGCIVSAFIEPIEEQIKMSAELGFDAVELWTGGFAHAKNDKAQDKTVIELAKAVESGLKHGLVVHGGHGLTYRNIEPVARIPGFTEFNIGHTIIARSVFVGLREAVREMKDLLNLYQPE
ncbi:MAG: pyridoxine 5'-phosphate synthase, partial [Phycisphaerae bacterium]|nr:pyridoxine 5'-phosphate synthase [Phycisphaerae bacterium]